MRHERAVVVLCVVVVLSHPQPLYCCSEEAFVALCALGESTLRLACVVAAANWLLQAPHMVASPVVQRAATKLVQRLQTGIKLTDAPSLSALGLLTSAYIEDSQFSASSSFVDPDAASTWAPHAGRARSDQGWRCGTFAEAESAYWQFDARYTRHELHHHSHAAAPVL